jgi:hypothetical protein
MKARKSRKKVAVTMTVLPGLVFFVALAYAGTLDPCAPSAPTMHTLDGIHNAVTDTSCGIAEREDYCQWFCVNPNLTPDTALVPAGKRACGQRAVSRVNKHCFSLPLFLRKSLLA